MLNLSSEKNAIRTTISAIFYLGLFMVVSCNSSELELRSNAQIVNTPIVQVSNTPKVKDSSEQAAIRLTELYDNRNCKEFFNAFPNNFQELNQLYGFDDKEGARRLYSKSEEHLSYFFGCSEVSDREKLKKAVEIGIDGKWEADAIGMFQNSTFNLIKTHPRDAKEILNRLPDGEAASFWFFLLDGAHPIDKEKVKRVDLLSNLLGERSKQSRLILEQFQKLRDTDKQK